MSRLPRVGMLGVGTIAEALTHGLCGHGERRVAEVLLSPRNAAAAERLRARYPEARIAPDNQAVLDGSDLVVLAVRPQVAEEVLGPLQFRPGQQILSLVATFSVERLRPLVAPAGEISRAVPLPPVAQRKGPLGLFSHSEQVMELLQGLGRLIRVDEEAHLDLISATTSMMATYFGMAGSIDGWLTQHGFAPGKARAFVAEMFFMLSEAAVERQDEPFRRLSREYSTPGGLNEQAWRELEAVGWGEDVGAALELVLHRIHGRADLSARLMKPR